jgi:NADH pyrophosphatase NudC (nudix superfamily)
MDAKDLEAFERRWQELAAEVMSGMAEWRVQHPRATFRQIEEALDERLMRMRARMLQDLALASSATDWASAPSSEHPVCPQCGRPLQRKGQQTRQIQTQGGQEVTLERRYGICPACGAGFFPPR